jgi:hypothetical protein
MWQGKNRPIRVASTFKERVLPQSDVSNTIVLRRLNYINLTTARQSSSGAFYALFVLQRFKIR